MKKIILLAATAIISTASFSQVNWGIQAIGGLRSGTLGDGEVNLNGKSRFAYGAGVVADAALSNEISFRPSLNFLKKGMLIESGTSENNYVEKFRFTTDLYYAELPLNFVYNAQTKFGKVFIGGGPSLGFGLSGKATVRYEYADPLTPLQVEEETTEAFDSEDNDGLGFKRFEVSASLIGGVQFRNNFFVNAGGLFGLSNLAPSGEEGEYKHKGFHLTLGMFFNRKK